MTTPVVFFGASKYVIPTILLLQNTYDLKLVVTTEMDPTDSVPSFCKKAAIPYVSVAKFDDVIVELLKNTHAEVGVLGYFGLLLPKRILSLFPKGIINIHPSLLPKYRGATPVQSALLNGDTETGVTIIKLDEAMDHGPVLVQEKHEITPEDTTPTLHDKLFTRGAELIAETLPQYLHDELPLTEQDHDHATFTQRSLTRQNGYITMTNLPAPEKLQLMIRAYSPWPGVWTVLNIRDKEVRVKLLPDNKLQVEGKKPLTVKDFINGYPEAKEIIEKLFPNS